MRGEPFTSEKVDETAVTSHTRPKLTMFEKLAENRRGDAPRRYDAKVLSDLIGQSTYLSPSSETPTLLADLFGHWARSNRNPLNNRRLFIVPFKSESEDGEVIGRYLFNCFLKSSNFSIVFHSIVSIE